MGFCHLTLRVPKPLPPEYPRELRSIGDHLRTERLKRGLQQKEVAATIGVDVNTIVGWEVGRAQPKVSYLPRIIGFLGYDPFQGEMTIAKRLRVERWKRGLTQYELARQLGVYKHTITLLETEKEVTNKQALAAVRRFLGDGAE